LARIQTSRSTAKRLKIDQLLADPLKPSLRCENPVTVAIDGRPDPARYATGLDPDRAIFVDLQVPCRKCGECLRVRANRWAARGAAEAMLSHRTWFGTLTWDPAHREVVKAIARRESRNKGYGDWEAMAESDQFAFLWKASALELTRYLKRVRKEAGTAFRYCAVVEAHKDGFPHVHMLFHEQLHEVRKRTLDGQWRVGFSQWRLVPHGEVRPVFYVAKYLAKHSFARVRASSSYGQGRKRPISHTHVSVEIGSDASEASE